MSRPIHIIGGGLAGCEAAWQVARAGIPAVVHEMRPVRQTPAHKTGDLAELVCSNSLKSESEDTAPWLLKQELRRLDSLLLEAARKARVPGGQALTVDREVFAAEVAAAIEASPLIELRREEVTAVPGEGPVVIATGPLTSDALAADIARLTGSDRLFFYDSISPIVDAETIDMDVAFRASRYDKSIDGTGDYINCPFTREEYERFLDALLEARAHTPAHRRRRALLRSLPAHRGAGPARPRHAALRPDEARRTGRSAHRTPSVGRGPTTPGEPAGRQL